jgi:imidazolonepropionase
MHNPAVDSLWKNARIATMQGAELGLIERGAIAVKDGQVAWVGPMDDMPPDMQADAQHDCAGALITPGLIDCHTHLVFAGNRAREFERRLAGASYEEIVRAGGGILSRVRATRAAGPSELLESARARLHTLMREGVTTIEIKSGYGLNLEDETKMLRVVRELGDREPVQVLATFLGAHAIPPEFAERADAYVEFLCETALPVVAQERLADAVDVFCENVGFTPAQTRRVFQAATLLGLPVKVHAEQLSNQQGAELAAGFHAMSADHLEHIDEAGVAAMAAAGAVAVMLPGAFYFLREARVPPIALFRRHGVPMAVASDVNPGTSPIVSLLASMHMACTLFRMTTVEVLRGVTVNAAMALRLPHQGVLATGNAANFCVWNIASAAELCYWMGGVKPTTVVFQGAVRDV